MSQRVNALCSSIQNLSTCGGVEKKEPFFYSKIQVLNLTLRGRQCLIEKSEVKNPSIPTQAREETLGLADQKTDMTVYFIRLDEESGWTS